MPTKNTLATRPRDWLVAGNEKKENRRKSCPKAGLYDRRRWVKIYFEKISLGTRKPGGKLCIKKCSSLA